MRARSRCWVAKSLSKAIGRLHEELIGDVGSAVVFVAPRSAARYPRPTNTAAKAPPMTATSQRPDMTRGHAEHGTNTRRQQYEVSGQPARPHALAGLSPFWPSSLPTS